MAYRLNVSPRKGIRESDGATTEINVKRCLEVHQKNGETTIRGIEERNIKVHGKKLEIRGVLAHYDSLQPRNTPIEKLPAIKGPLPRATSAYSHQPVDNLKAIQLKQTVGAAAKEKDPKGKMAFKSLVAFGTAKKKEPKDKMDFKSLVAFGTAAAQLEDPNAMAIILQKFDPDTKTFKILEVTQVTVHKKIGDGGFRRAWKVRKGNDTSYYVLKAFLEEHLKNKSQTPEELSKLYAMKTVQTQMFARRICEAFNAKCGNSLSVLEAVVVKLPNGNYGTLEPFLLGEYNKYYNNDMRQLDKYSLLFPRVSALVHFSWEYTQHEAIITDLQGVGNHLTDPEVATKRFSYKDERMFNMGNWHKDAIIKFGKEHKCNNYCQQAGVYGKPIIV